jgi:hypothetical protein
MTYRPNIRSKPSVPKTTTRKKKKKKQTNRTTMECPKCHCYFPLCQFLYHSPKCPGPAIASNASFFQDEPLAMDGEPLAVDVDVDVEDSDQSSVTSSQNLSAGDGDDEDDSRALDDLDFRIQNMQIGPEAFPMNGPTRPAGAQAGSNPEEEGVQPASHQEECSPASEEAEPNVPFELSILDEIGDIEGISLHDKSMLALILHCNGSNAPKGFFDSFMVILKKEMKVNNFNVSKADRRDTFIGRMRKHFPCPLPSFVDVIVNTSFSNLLKMKMNPTNFIKVMKFDFLLQVKDLLSDFSIWGDLENLCVNRNPEDLFKPFVPGDTDRYLEVLGSDWYK